MANVDTFTTETFQHMQLAAEMEISDYAASINLPTGQWDVKLFRREIARSLTMQLRGWLLTRQRDCHIAYPKDWWEAVKDRFAPAWFLRRYPVQHTVVDLVAKAFWESAPVPHTWGKETRMVVSVKRDGKDVYVSS